MSGSIAVCTYTAAQNVISCDVYICCMMMQQCYIAQVKCPLSKHETEIARRFYDPSLGRLATSKSRHCSPSRRQQSRITFIVCVNLPTCCIQAAPNKSSVYDYSKTFRFFALVYTQRHKPVSLQSRGRRGGVNGGEG